MSSPTFTLQSEGYGLTPLATDQTQWLRKFRLVIGNAAGEGLDLSDFHVRFEVASQVKQTPRLFQARLWNLRPETVRTIQNEGVSVLCNAGYQTAQFGLIFSGHVTQTRRGGESPVDRYLDITATDGDLAYTKATVNATLPAGWKPERVLDTLVKSMQGYSVDKDAAPPLSDNQAPRGRVLFGPTRDHMRAFGNANGLDWSLEDTRVKLVSRLHFIPGDALVLSSKTGMVGIPEQTCDGLNVRCLLNPNMQTGRVLQVSADDIAQTSYHGYTGTDITRLPDLAPDGFYKAYFVRHIGDTRGNDWYSEAICEVLDRTAPGFKIQSDTYKNAVVNGL